MDGNVKREIHGNLKKKIHCQQLRNDKIINERLSVGKKNLRTFIYQSIYVISHQLQLIF